MRKQKKSIRLTLQFSVDIDEARIPAGDDLRDQEYNDRQRRLLQSILSHKENYRAYLHYCVASCIDGLTWQDWHELLLGEEKAQAKEILAPMITTMNEEDQAFFKEAEEEGVLSENVEKAEGCFSTSLESTEIVVEDGNE